MYDGGQFPSPLRGSSQDDRAGARNDPIARSIPDPAGAMSQPAMAANLEPNAGYIVQISLKSDRFPLIVPAAKQPLDGNRPRKQANGDSRVLEEMGCKSKVGL